MSKFENVIDRLFDFFCSYRISIDNIYFRHLPRTLAKHFKTEKQQHKKRSTSSQDRLLFLPLLPKWKSLLIKSEKENLSTQSNFMSKFSSNPPAFVPTATPSSSYEYTPVNNASVVDSGKNTEAEVVYLAESQVQVVPDLHTQVPVSVQGNSSTTSHPPSGCPDGGQWGKIKYVGNNTSLLACLACFYAMHILFLQTLQQGRKDG